ncbi:D-alanyl-D-alanine carboxypeptidase [Devosia sp. BK]|uniref:D-alanyl-D-alanine carboxypeptidase family protein n=1 Tax=Devosia sp. BK TaxID=2871706 RepID=UPI00293B2AB8|nr:D-alanyl-D-alanine carboxypeptidase family protein [Devosia sp. BK]MDV3250924.1 D-alanyl-D-alanine carboxypeptidase [Devosia sp. BK]
MRFPVLLLRRFAIALALSLLSLVPALANPMLLVDRDNLNVLYAEQAGQPWHPASLTKLMTAYVAFEEIAKGTVTLDTPVTLSKYALTMAPSRSGLKVGTSVSLEDALYILIVKSANDMAVAIAETIGGNEANFVAKMNDVARRMGLTATHYENPHGLHDPLQVTSARDLAVLALYIEQSFPQYMPMFHTSVVRIGNLKLESQNNLLTTFSGAIGMKTGFVCASGLNLVADVDRNGRRLLAVVLGGSSGRDRNERAAELLLKGLSGSATPTGQTILNVSNAVGAAPVDMRANICGKDAATYVKAQEAAFPMGMKGQPSYLTDQIAAVEHVATDLGRMRTDIALPRPRPAHVPAFPSAALVSDTTTSASALDANLRPGLELAGSPGVPYPRPRPASR